MEQKYSSANTSINSSKLPAVYNKYQFNNGDRVLDYGCGKYTDHIKERMDELGCEWFGYDKYNQPTEVNEETKKQMKKKFDIGICSNVLNVIDSMETIEDIIHEIKDCCNTAVFYIYEGNQSGNGSVTKDDCWQRNEKTDSYAELMRDMGYEPTVKGRMITLKDELTLETV